MGNAARKSKQLAILATSDCIFIFLSLIIVLITPSETHEVQLTRGSPVRLPVTRTSTRFAPDLILLEVEKNYHLVESYTFSIPQVNVSCKCDCDDDIHKGAMNNVNELVTQGAVLRYSKRGSMVNCHSYQLECNISLGAHKDEKFVAIHIDNPWTTYKIAVISYNSSLEVYDVPENIQRFATDDGTVIEMPSAKQKHQLPVGWYYFPQDRKALFANAPLNKPNEYNIEKLGWFRMTSSEYAVEHSVYSQLQKALTINLTACFPNLTLFNWDIKAAYFYDKYDLQSQVGEPLQSVYGNIFRDINVRKESNMMTLVYQKELPISVNVTTRRLGTDQFMFWAKVTLDQYSNRRLEIILQGVSGTVIGNIGSDRVSVHISTQEATRITKTMRLSSSIINSQWLCMYPSGNRDNTLCRWTKFHEQLMHNVYDNKVPDVDAAQANTNLNYATLGNKVDLNSVVISALVAGCVLVVELVGVLIFVLWKTKRPYLPIGNKNTVANLKI